jgi:4-hydroxy-tetrahydrodipicolinate reductase
MLRIAIVGNGRMGKAVSELATARGHTIETIIESAENAKGQALTRERLGLADVVIEFTRPDVVVCNLERLIELRVPTVTGTTGWAGSLPEIVERVKRGGGALLYSANFSIGVQLFLRAARELARSSRSWPEFDATIIEEHHAGKVDSPSGTALVLQRQLAQEDQNRPFPITSIRAGEATGTHTLSYDAPHETVRLSHIARSREIFAAGALAAAEWLPGRAGVFTFEDMLFGGTT